MTTEQSDSQLIPAVEASTNSSTMADLLTLAAAKHAGNVALKHKVGEEWHEVTYAELLPIVRSISKGLIANGISLGDKVAILSNTRPEWTYADFGALCAGATVAPIYQTNSPEEVEYVLNHSEAKLVVVEDEEQLNKIKRVRDQLTFLEKVVIIDPDAADLGEAISLEELKSQGAEISDDEFEQRVAAVTPDDLCTIVYTSGTTGPPKGCMISHGNYRATTSMGESTLVGDNEELIYLFLPLAHVFARLVQFVSIDVGGTIAYWQKDPTQIIPDVIGLQPDSLPSVPRIFEKLYTLANNVADAKSPEEKAMFKKAIEVGSQVRELQSQGKPVPEDLQKVFDAADEPVYQMVRNLFGGKMKRAVTGAAPIAAEILEFFFACGVPVYEGYGMTETSTLATSNNSLTGYRIGSVGKPVLGCEVKIAGDGEIMIKGPNIFKGYYKDEAATAETIDADGWLHTGDLGMIDEDGFVFITGRKKDIIITAGGKNLTPANFENAMKQNRWVSQAVMFGDRRPYPVALLTLDPEELPALAAQLGIENDNNIYSNPKVTDLIQSVVDEVNTKFANVEQVKKIRILDHDLTIETGELTPSMKVKRNIVHEKYGDIYDAMYEG
ncbi:MAG: long-chain fatty acid--CoA ligase [Thermoleophilaceae bacterium]|nr:long-chain fatty acid--CoA ligase [Thermoleophilaceae bacterium]